MVGIAYDLELTDEEIIQIYGKRWNIEVFFKTTKSFLNLAKEFQGRSYDAMVAIPQSYSAATSCLPWKTGKARTQVLCRI